MGKVASTTKTKKDASFKPANIQEHLIFSRAVEAVIWGMPAVNFEFRFYGPEEALFNIKPGSCQI
ncbi:MULTISPECIES: hypothetical protein [Niastella]|uniref:Uncharacterized protein n=1 Tax=Niastella soli TaxID=2821487 RepID=A0ABS3Z2I8_9BACT|nr:hypothetical protein [Niastella soli]MBO9203890.1 hypothetical protein [Niastella soli]